MLKLPVEKQPVKIEKMFIFSWSWSSICFSKVHGMEGVMENMKTVILPEHFNIKNVNIIIPPPSALLKISRLT